MARAMAAHAVLKVLVTEGVDVGINLGLGVGTRTTTSSMVG